jgi:hypothetical protein
MKRWQAVTLALAIVVALGAATGYTKAAAPSAPGDAPPPCLHALKLMNSAVATMGQASRQYSAQILPAYKAGVARPSTDAIVMAENRATAKVNRATALVRKATPLALACKES